jgi:branched-chain amino acid transport system substrate-binding protein
MAIPSSRRGWRWRARMALLAALPVVVLAACGPRRPHSDYLAAAAGSGGGLRAGEGATGALAGAGQGAAGGASGELGASSASASGSSQSGGGSASATGGVGGGGGLSATGGGSGATGSGGGANGASDVGVTADSILVGNITSVGGALGPNVFSPSYYGASAYFQQLNAKGGINGRRIKFVTCDDKEDPNLNLQCASSLIDQKIFAFVANDSRVGNGSANYINSKGVTDVGDFCIGNWCTKYPHIFGLYTFRYPRNGKTVGINGQVESQDGPWRWFKEHLNVTKAAVFFYDIAISRQAGLQWADALRRQGVQVVYYGGGSDQGENPAAPTYDTDVIEMRSKGVDMIVNAIDMNGFQKLCQSMDRYGFTVKANVGNPQAYGQVIGTFSSPCRNSVYSSDYAKNYADGSDPAVGEIQAAMKKYYPNVPLHEWVLDGWAQARKFTEAVASLGPNVTRAGVEKWLDALRDYTAGGLLAPQDYRWPYDYSKPDSQCFSIAQWQDSAHAMVTRAPVTTCYTMPWVAYTPANDGS